MFATNDFSNHIRNFATVSPKEARVLLEQRDGAILFLGRETCPYCRKFAPKLAEAATKENWKVYFLDTESANYSQAEIAQLRKDYPAPTVPALLHAKESGIAIKCDSSLTVEEIIQFVKN